MLLSNSNMNYDQMRRVVLEYVLSIDDFTQYNSILSGVAQLLVSKQLAKDTEYYSSPYMKSTPELTNIDADLVNEIVWDLIIERVLSIGANKGNSSWPFLRLTRYGKTLANTSETVIIHDVDGMMNLLKSNVPNCDSVILSYFGECLETYRINQLLSSSVMLGCATEKLICLLYDAYYFWLLRSKGENNREVANLKNAKSKSISRQFELLTASIKSHKEELEPLLFEDYDLCKYRSGSTICTHF